MWSQEFEVRNNSWSMASESSITYNVEKILRENP